MTTFVQPPLDDRASVRAAAVFALITLFAFGLLYCLSGTAIGRLLFPQQATGSLIMHGGNVVGSALVAQPFADPKYFQSRPSAANYDPMAASGSNLSRSNPDLRARIDDSVASIATREGIAPNQVPYDLLTQSGGGLDPHISPRGAAVQIARVARVRAIDVAKVSALVDAHTEPAQFGVLGQPRVNVLQLNLALDALNEGTSE